ncbi:hypothetical protein EYD45_00280 [Hyunsoonleella flava]|uniref:Uncharacterized protein n=1 Tax=Hyunsoonleella flava TaxID=2527939 RepID=A0A4Q9FH21_9FLAO|nr:hypothetical protein [Hyunsoonleella flava]TBN06358.1 hypothetical protein EYD45_00280 [Hyunsoonleella flava]
MNQVAIQENEIRQIKAISDELFIILKIHLTFFHGFRVYGSITRGTSLSPSISRKTDVDVFCQYDFGSWKTLIEYNKGIDSNVLTTDIIYKGLVNLNNEDFKDIKLDYPSVHLSFKGIIFELTPARGEKGRDMLTLSLPYREWEYNHRHLLPLPKQTHVRSTSGNKDDDFKNGKPVSKIETILPYVYNDRVKTKENNSYFYLIVLLKYWKYVFQSNITSFLLESDVFDGLEKSNFFNGKKDLGDLLFTFLTTPEVYNFKLFKMDNQFSELYNNIVIIKKHYDNGEEEDAFYKLIKCFPPLDYLKKYTFPCSEFD